MANDLYEYKVKNAKVISADYVSLEVDLGFGISVNKEFWIWGVTAPLPIAGEEGDFDEAKKYVEWWLQRYKNQDLRVRSWKLTPGVQGKMMADIYYMHNGLEQRLSDTLIDKALVEPIRGNGFYSN